jgi:hypothetical protein
MSKLNLVLGVMLMLLGILSASVWLLVLAQRPHAVTSTAPAAPAFVELPTEPATGSGIDFTFMIGKPMTLPADTIICGDLGDLIAYWNTNRAAIDAGNDAERRAAVTTALAASCQITQGVTFGTILGDEPASPATPDELIAFRSAADGNRYWVHAVSVSP